VPASGRYSVVIGLWQDRSGRRLTMAASDTFDLEPAHEWSGQACTLPAVQGQLAPLTRPPTPLLCPGAPPPLP